MSSINSLARQSLINQNIQFNRMQKKQLRKEELKQEEIEQHELEQNQEDSIFEKALFEHQDNLSLVQKGTEESVAKPNTIFIPTISKRLSSYVSSEDVELLSEFFLDDTEFMGKLNTFCSKLLTSVGGSEINLLEEFLQKYNDSPALIYLALSYVLDELEKQKRKLEFKQQLEEIKQQYEQQEAGYLLEFFDLLKSDKLKKQTTTVKLEQITKLNNGQVQADNLKSAIEFVHANFDGGFANIVSIYMNVKANQLKELNKNLDSVESSSKLFELVKFEKYLILINSIHKEYNQFYDNCTKENRKDLSPSEIREALLGLTTFCEYNYVSQVNIDKLLKTFNLANPALKQNLTGQQYLRFFHDLGGFLRGLPLAMFQYNDGNLHKLLAGIKKLQLDYSLNIARTDSLKDSKIIRPRKEKTSITRYI